MTDSYDLYVLYTEYSAAANLCVKKLFGTIVEYTENKKKINGGQKKRINIGIGIYCVRPARMCSSVPLLEPGPPRFFWLYENSE